MTSCVLSLLRRWAGPALAATLLLTAGDRARAAEPREIVSAGGIKAWLAGDHASPLLALRFAFLGGSGTEPDGQAGITRLLARMLVEGGGDDDAQVFRERMQRAGMRLQFQAGRDALFGSVDILSSSRTESTALLRAAVQNPKLDAATLETVKSRMLTDLIEAASDPRAVANDRWYAESFAGLAYAHPPEGDPAGLAGIDRDKLARRHAVALTRGTLVVAAAGDIAPDELGALLDAVFGGLPEGVASGSLPVVPRTTADLMRVETSSPAAAVVFGAAAPPPGDPDHVAARIVAHILGSGDLDSRLFKRLRLDTSLVYSARAGILHDSRTTLLLGELGTSNDKAESALDTLLVTLRSFAEDGPGDDEIELAKSALAGATLLGLDSTAAVADALLDARLDGQTADFLARRRVELSAVTPAQVRSAARRLVAPDRIRIIVASRSQR